MSDKRSLTAKIAAHIERGAIRFTRRLFGLSSTTANGNVTDGIISGKVTRNDGTTAISGATVKAIQGATIRTVKPF